MYKKIVESGVKTQEKFLRGVEVVDKIVGDTLGPAGRNRIIQQKYKAPWIINDGAEIARRIVLEDPVEDLAAQTIIEVSMKTAEQAGDGTTTSVVLASALVKKCLGILAKEGKKSILEGGVRTNPMKLWKQIQEEKDKAVELLKASAKELKDKDLEKVISTSLENMEYGKTLANLLREIGIDGYISVEDNWATKYGITTEITSGMRFLGTYASPYLATSSNKKEAIYENADVLVTNHRIETLQSLKDLIMKMRELGKKRLVIIGGYSEGENPFSEEFIRMASNAINAVAQGMPNVFELYAIKAPSLTSAELEDVSAFCDAKFYDKKLGMELKDIQIQDLGHAEKISVDESDVNILHGRGNTDARIKVLKEQLELEKDVMFKEKLKRRIAGLSKGVGIIRVGALTESERSYLKEKLKDAVSAAKVAMQEGYVKGGGLSFIDVAKKLGKESLLYDVLHAPNERIKQNAGEDIEIPATVINPLKVDRLALENACSGAGMLITSDGAIAEQKLTYNDYLEKAFSKAIPRDDRDDWRDDENQDPGRGSNVN